jgi:hypothetical protein
MSSRKYPSGSEKGKEKN